MTTKVDAYRAQLPGLKDWEQFLLDNSNLPGPRANLELVQAAADLGSAAQFARWAALGPAEAPAQTAREFLPVCGAVGLGRLLAEGDRSVLPALRRLAGDPRWRVREAVAMALQRWGGGYIKLPYPGAGYEAPDTSRLIADDWPSDYTRPQSLNRWAYVEGDPINRIDPSGHWYCQSGLVPFGADCDTWVDNALATLRSSGPVGRRLEQFFHARDRALTIAGLAGMLICPPVSVYVTGVKIYFEPLVTRPLRSKAFTVNPDQIHINNTLAGYYGPNPSSEAVVSFGHEIAHLAQGIYEFSVQAEFLGTIVGYFLEDEVGASHRDDADYIIQNKLDPWNDLDLEEYNTQGILIPLPWPLRIGRGLSDNWLDQWGISLPYLNPPTSRESGLPGGGR